MDGKLSIAIGSTVLTRGLQKGGLDGIGVYTQELLKYLKQYSEFETKEVVFRGLLGASSSSSLIPGRFHLDVLRSVLTGLSFSGTRLLKNKIALFHATDHYIPKLRDVPVVATLMDPVPLMRPDWANSTGRRLKNSLFRRSAQWATQYITISQAVVPDLVEHFGIPEEKITPIHLGVNCEDFSSVSEEQKAALLKKWHLNPGFFLFIGTLQPRKNVGQIIQAFKQLSPEMQRAHPLVIVGREGWSVEKEVAQLRRWMEEGIAHWLGYVSIEDKKALLQTAGALVFPSLYEGFGLPVLEAFASRLPVITSTTSSLPEIAGDAAWLVNPLDADALADMMKQMIEKPELFRSLIEKGYQRAQAMTWQRCTEKTVAVYKTLLNN